MSWEPILALLVSGLFGYKGAKNLAEGEARNTEAKALTEQAERKLNDAEAQRKKSRDEAQVSLSSLDEQRRTLDETLVRKAVSCIGRVRNVDVKSLAIGESLPSLSSTALLKLPDAAIQPVDIVKSGGTAIAAGVLAGMATFGATSKIARASTGTPIDDLQGAPRKKATLARLGGGTKEEGGGGEDGGRLVLGITASTAALWAGSIVFEAKALVNLASAKTGAAAADKAVAEMQTQTSIYQVINQMAALFKDHLESLKRRGVVIAADLEKLLTDAGEDYNHYDTQQRNRYRQAYEFTSLFCQLLALPLVGTEDQPDPETSPALLAAKNLLDSSVC